MDKNWEEWKEFFENPDISLEEKGTQAEQLFPVMYNKFVKNTITYMVKLWRDERDGWVGPDSETVYIGPFREEAFNQVLEEKNSWLVLEVWANGCCAQIWRKEQNDGEFGLRDDFIGRLKSRIENSTRTIQREQAEIEEVQKLLTKIDVLDN